MFKHASGLAAAALIALAPLAADAQTAKPAYKDVVKTYADIAQAGYEDSASTAKALKKAIDALVANPSEATLAAARTAWLNARVPYMQTEAFRFGNPIVDEWEGKVNAWPLDEGLIDYVDDSYAGGDSNPFAKANVIANPKIKAGDKTIDARKITKELLADTLHEAGKVEANVATGYHAVEFLLWGQDLNGTGPGAGARKATDYAKGKDCTNGNCDRRAQFLTVATQMLVEDLEEMAKAWGAKGKARASIAKAKESEGVARILTGLGSLSYGELAGERMKLGLMLHDPEEEHDCFSDNTHNSHYYDQVGMVNVYNGRYTRVDGKVVTGPSLSQYVAATAPEADAKVKEAMTATTAAMKVMKDTADSGKMAYDQMIGTDNAEGNAIISTAVDRLVDQKKALESVVAALGVSVDLAGSDSLDNPSAVGK
ncbi:peptidase [Azospirillum brasilense]|uniref:imelysin family protein n=1 Tax=Azospirillum brasilense TaxID=192 RepID=UPI000E69658E|nr:imelysin family protein [Azospirillum brasilense]NUB15751.1 peptidase [Azospirillum brasilense]NUB28564.1 peptidase [Azospirillum brasilense]NUB34561.1 peptidase [Azospirillum brasilense]RIV98351.1 peptidase [Azospirillum brasilense]